MAGAAKERGSVLLLAVLLVALLASLLLLCTNAFLLAKKSSTALSVSIELLYTAEAGLAHGRHALRALYPLGAEPGTPGESGEEPDVPLEGAPFGRWTTYGNGAYFLEGTDLAQEEPDGACAIDRDSGVLLEVAASRESVPQRRVCLLLDTPPSLTPLAWWEPD